MAATACHVRDVAALAFPGLLGQGRHHGQPRVPLGRGRRCWACRCATGLAWPARRPGRLPGLPAARPRAGASNLSVRVAAWDTAGNRIEQEIIRAWPLPPEPS